MSADDTSIHGTHEVRFERADVAGLVGCILRYRAVHADQGGTLWVVNGHIGVIRAHPDQNSFLALKITVRDLHRNTAESRPVFAYLATRSASTVHMSNKPRDLDHGYRLFGFALIEPTTLVLTEMLQDGAVTIGYKRRDGDADVLLPIDLRVYEAEPIPGGTYRRKRSSEALIRFERCIDAQQREER